MTFAPTKKLLYIGDDWAGDKQYVETFGKLEALRTGVKVVTSFSKRENATEVAMLAKQHGCDAVITSQQSLMEAALRQLPDFIPPATRKALTLDDYAGSLIDLPFGIPLLIINPLERLHTVPYEKFVLNRYLTKLTRPDRWFPQTPFKWKQVFEHTVDEVLSVIAAADLVAIDIETLEHDGRPIDLVGYCAYSFATGECRCFVVDFNSEWAWRFVQRANATKAGKILQNGQYDSSYFLRWNAPIHNWLWDTLTLMHCWYSELPKRLDFIATFALRKVRYWKDDGKNGGTEDKMRYNAMDVWATMNSFLSMMSEIPAYAMRNYLIEFPMNFPSLHAGMEGIAVDVVKFREVRAQKEAEAQGLLNRVQYLTSTPTFNPRSPLQMKKLFKLLGMGEVKSTDKASTLKARAASPLNDLVLGLTTDYKAAAKLISSYLGEKVLWHDRFFYMLDPAGTDTGRSASKGSPFWCGANIQNIPRGDAIKQCLVADLGWLLAEADKAQSEARCVGYMAGDTKLIELVESPRDYHAWNAQEFFGIPYESIYCEATRETLNKEIRDLSKRTNHGANYNMGEGVMLDTMGPKNVAKAKLVLKLPLKMRLKAVCGFLLERYAATYPRVKGLFYDSIISYIEINSKLISPLGWTRFFFAKPSRKNKPALNAAVAHGPQNLSVSIINREWYAIWRETVYGSLRDNVRIKAQIHDSILFQYREGYDPATVLGMMNTPVTVVGADGVSRVMLIPSDMKSNAKQWSKLK